MEHFTNRQKREIHEAYKDFYSPKLLKTLREAQGHTIRSLGKKAGLNKKTAHYAELGKHRPTRKTLQKIAWALQVPWELLAVAVGYENLWGIEAVDLAFPNETAH